MRQPIHRGGYKKVYPEKFAEVREQIQEDIATYMDGMPIAIQDLCQIVVDNFKKFEKWITFSCIKNESMV